MSLQPYPTLPTSERDVRNKTKIIVTIFGIALAFSAGRPDDTITIGFRRKWYLATYI